MTTWMERLHPTRLRKRAGGLVVDGFFNGIARAGKLHPLARPSRHGVEVVENIAYKTGGDRAHLLDVWRPARHKEGQPLPTILYVHGGGFRILSKDTHWVMALGFARRGWQVVSINYRLAPQHRFPAAIEDVCDAFVWLVKHAAEYQIDLNHLVFAGESAGGNLVTALALATSWRRPEPFAQRAFDCQVQPRAVLPACGMLQVSDVQRVRRRKPQLSKFVEDRLAEVSDAYLGPQPTHDLALADPLTIIESPAAPDRPLPPFFAGVGTWDPLLDDTRRLKVALDARGVHCEVRYYPKELHAFHALVMRAQAKQFWLEQFGFLTDLGLMPQ
jgi:acetyl esterase